MSVTRKFSRGGQPFQGAALCTGIIYWAKINKYKRKLRFQGVAWHPLPSPLVTPMANSCRIWSNSAGGMNLPHCLLSDLIGFDISYLIEFGVFDPIWKC